MGKERLYPSNWNYDADLKGIKSMFKAGIKENAVLKPKRFEKWQLNYQKPIELTKTKKVFLML